jgi:hypothetical protein
MKNRVIDVGQTCKPCIYADNVNLPNHELYCNYYDKWFNGVKYICKHFREFKK